MYPSLPPSLTLHELSISQRASHPPPSGQVSEKFSQSETECLRLREQVKELEKEVDNKDRLLEHQRRLAQQATYAPSQPQPQPQP